MADYKEIEATLAKDLIQSMGLANSMGSAKAEPPLVDRVNALINVIPYYNNPEWIKAHRGALSILLATNLPSAAIDHEPDQPNKVLYKYDGPYQTYRDAFYPGITLSPAAADLQLRLNKNKLFMNNDWWGKYGVAILTDAIRKKIGLQLNTGKLDNDLKTFSASLNTALAESYLSILMNGYGPTTAAFNAISLKDRLLAAYTLNDGIDNGQFTANINEVMSEGGEYAIAATWFLFNLWIILKSLGMLDIDTHIQKYISRGLSVPPQIGPVDWWNGGYTDWFPPLSGHDVDAMAATAITATFPELMRIFTPRVPSSYRPHPVTNGYSQSFCYWGGLSWYR